MTVRADGENTIFLHCRSSLSAPNTIYLREELSKTAHTFRNVDN
jgi:hypothetical protein